MSKANANDPVLKSLDAAQKALEEARKGYLALLARANEVEADEETEVEEAGEVEARIIYWDADDADNNTNLEEMDLKELKAFAKEAKISLTAKDAEGIRQEIYENYYPSEVVEEEAEQDEEQAADEDAVSTVIVVMDADDNEVQIDLAEMDVKGLKEFGKTYGLTLKGKTQDDLIQEIIDALYPAEQEEEASESEDEQAAEDAGEEQSLADYYGLTSMSVEDLANLLTSYGLSPRGKKEALVDRALQAIQDGTIPVEEPEAGE